MYLATGEKCNYNSTLKRRESLGYSDHCLRVAEAACGCGAEKSRDVLSCARDGQPSSCRTKDMREALFTKMEELPEEIDTVLLAMGLCGGSVSERPLPVRLIMPKVDDCITLLMHTDDTWYPNLKKGGHLYLTDTVNGKLSVPNIRRDLVEKYGEKKGLRIFAIWFDSYRSVDIIDTGVYDCRSDRYLEMARENAELIDCDLCYVGAAISYWKNWLRQMGSAVPDCRKGRIYETRILSHEYQHTISPGGPRFGAYRAEYGRRAAVYVAADREKRRYESGSRAPDPFPSAAGRAGRGRAGETGKHTEKTCGRNFTG